jgi:hypothetical protein
MKLPRDQADPESTENPAEAPPASLFSRIACGLAICGEYVAVLSGSLTFCFLRPKAYQYCGFFI